MSLTFSSPSSARPDALHGPALGAGASARGSWAPPGPSSWSSAFSALTVASASAATVRLLKHRSSQRHAGKGRKNARVLRAVPEVEVVNPVAIALRSRLSELQKQSGGQGSERWEDLGGAKLLLPASSIPWGVVHFIGGAVLGQFPELCYSALLRPLADRVGVAVICTPYELGSDHATLAATAGALFETAVSLAAAKYGWSAGTMPRIALGHSLGAKLQVLLQCREATDVNIVLDRAPTIGVGLLAFNNFGVEDQVRLLKETLQTMQGGGPFAGAFNTPGSAADRFWAKVVEPVIGRAVQMSGIQFTPGPDELLEMVRNKYDGVSRTQLFSFEGDSLDCSEELVEALSERAAPGPAHIWLQGGHLAPVVVSMSDVGQAAASSARGAAGQVASRFQERFSAAGSGVTLGNQEDLNELVEKLYQWLRGRR